MSLLGLLAIAPVIFAVGYAFAYPYLKEPPFVRRDYVGRVADKYRSLRESQTGTRVGPTLLVEGRDGGRFKVGVTEDFYERARVGMWVTRRAGELELSRDEPEPGPAAAESGQAEGR